MKKLFVLAALLTVGTLSANAQTGTTTTTTRQTTTQPGYTTGDQTTNPSSTTTTTESTTTSDNRMGTSARTKNGKTMIIPADGAKVKGNGKKLKVK